MLSGGLIVSVLDIRWGFPQLAGIGLLLGFGQGMVNPAATTISLELAPAELTATAGSAMSFLRNIGLTAGPALMSAIWGLGSYSLVAMRSAVIVATLFALIGVISVIMSARGQMPAE
jgi:MFS family permease